MQEMKNTRSRIIQQAIASQDIDRIDQALDMLQDSEDLEAWAELLEDTIIDLNGRLHASPAMILPAAKQFLADYALLELIGRAPEGVELNPTLQKRNIRKLQFRKTDRAGGTSITNRPFPRGIYQMYALEDIDIHSVPVGDLPGGISALTALRRLRLANAGVSRLPDDIAGCQRLEWLDLSLNGWYELPNNLTDIRSLMELHLDGNNLASLPDSFQNLCQLQVIRLPENRFREIPEILTQMPSLKKIIISYNKLTGVIPAGMADLPELELLDMTGNGRMNNAAGTGNVRSNPSENDDPSAGSETSSIQRSGGFRVMEDQYIEQPADEAPGERIRAWVENIEGYFSSEGHRGARAGIALISTINDTELFRYLLRHWSIRNGELVCDAPEDDRQAGAYIKSSDHVIDLLFHNDNDYLKTAFDLSRLTKLGLGFKSIIFPGISKLVPNVEDLKISLLDQNVPQLLSSFRHIRKLKVLGTDEIKSFDIDGWPLLEEIDHMGGSCKAFSIRNCPSLTTLQVRGSVYNEIRLSNNPRLEKASLTPERIEVLKIDACSSLRSLKIGGRGDIKHFRLEDLSQLESLMIDRPVNMSLVGRLLESPDLRDIKLGTSRNRVPVIFEIETLPAPASRSIQSFSLKEIGIRVIPDWMLHLEKLELLDLSDNLLEEIPRDWTGLKSLQQLALDHNQIGKIPEDIRFPPSLRELHLGQNRLSSLPAILADLPALEYLQLDTQSSMASENTSLRTIPPALSGKPGLQIRISMDEMEKRKMIVEGLAWQISTFGRLLPETDD
jgi:Leucine-rich repeat (LRR) protein